MDIVKIIFTSLGSLAAMFCITRLIGNIQREYGDLVLADVDGEEGVYQYKDGTLTYVCTLEEALLKT